MRTGRPKHFEITLSATERAQLMTLATSRALPHSVVRRARIILQSADGDLSTVIAGRAGVTPQVVGHWRRRWQAHGLAGLYDAPRPGPPRTYDDDRVATLLRTVL